ncbi:MFS transporter [Cohnella pontilimi]|uniref:MFS transporter n=1 Tax=Cohnella pontilimi TaxID=2564100 RepID=A0A4U0FDF6_9BACL|nr:MFS transporter [Cohnella pontilimi]TJY42801.1 MFS transporter [Cohnella pontilimi]
MKRLRYVLSGQACSTLGDILYILALVTTLYRQTGSAAVAALFPLLRVIGMSTGSFGAPLVLRRYRLSRLLAFCLLVQCCGLALLALYLGTFAGRAQVEWLTSAVLVLSVLEGVAGPARSSLVPRIVENDELLKANGTLGAVSQACSLAGWAGGAIAVSALGSAASLWVAALLLLFAGVSSLLIREESGFEASEEEEEAGGAKSLLQGWKMFLRVPSLRLLLWMDVWGGLLSAAFAGALLLVFAEQQLGVGEVWWGWMNGAFCAGLIAANWGIGQFVQDARRKLAFLLLAGSGGLALSVLIFSFTVHPEMALAVMVVIGFAESAAGLAGTTMIQFAAPKREMPSVFAARTTLISVLFGVSLLVAGWLADRYGIQMIYIGASVCYAISFLGAVWRRGVLREMVNER